CGGDITRSFVVGDNACDIEMGERLGATTILVRTGHGARIERNQVVRANYIVEDLAEAASVIAGIVGFEGLIEHGTTEPQAMTKPDTSKRKAHTSRIREYLLASAAVRRIVAERIPDEIATALALVV